MYGKNLKYGFDIISRGELRLLVIPQFLENGFEKHCFTTRIGGVSPNEYKSLNLSKTREESLENKHQNYERVCAALGVEYKSLCLVNYAHGDGIHFSRPIDAGKGILTEIDYDFCDAMITNSSEVTAVTLHADCTPIFFADSKKRVVAAVHAGWKGVHQNLPKKVCEALVAQYNCNPDDIMVGIGPHIMQCCFEVKEDVASFFREKFGSETIKQRDKSLFVDMQSAVLLQLEQAGIVEENITCANLCTYCEEKLFYSHRRDNGNTGAMGSFITV